ncbi:hypothetical protein LJC45_05365 [Alistipes sp. OttesenSCG-928-B03]|nr:hypothetical protein [Alistipes sp. OttesenSCG-928-B03]
MKNAKLLILASSFLLTYVTCYGQKKDITKIYHREMKNSSILWGSHYVTTILRIYEDSTYNKTDQIFISRRHRRKNISTEINEENGKWRINGDTLALKSFCHDALINKREDCAISFYLLKNGNKELFYFIPEPPYICGYKRKYNLRLITN